MLAVDTEKSRRASCWWPSPKITDHGDVLLHNITLTESVLLVLCLYRRELVQDTCSGNVALSGIVHTTCVPGFQ